MRTKGQEAESNYVKNEPTHQVPLCSSLGLCTGLVTVLLALLPLICLPGGGGGPIDPVLLSVAFGIACPSLIGPKSGELGRMGWFVGDDAADADPPGRPVPPESGVEASDSRGVKRNEAAREKDDERETVVPLGRVLIGGEPVPPAPVVVGGGLEAWLGDEDSGADEAGGALDWSGLDMAVSAVPDVDSADKHERSRASESEAEGSGRGRAEAGTVLAHVDDQAARQHVDGM